MKKLLLIAALVFFFSANSYSQISQGGKPYSFYASGVSDDYTVKVLTPPDLKLIMQEDISNEKNGILRKVGRSIFVDISPENSGTWETLPNGDRLWRLKINSPGALALGVYYNHFWLPAGGRLFLYNDDRTQVIGAFTQDNNPESGLFATELIAGESATLEYYEPSRTKGMAVISISEIAYVYRDFKFRNGHKDFGESESCEVNINCSEGTNWQDEKKGVARIFLKIGMQYGWCTGTLLNNENADCTPYFLTADHCGEGSSAADRNQWVFHFNYEAAGCANPASEPTFNSITGCTLKANGGNGGSSGSDFFLVQLSSAPTFNPYFNGWDRNNTASASGVSIHHPNGDIKKISTYTSPLTSTSWGGSVQNTHWQVVWAATTNGHGVTEPGSSGSPLFNNAGLVVGDLTGGGSYCNTPTQPDAYGKLSYSWDQNGTTAATRLKDWLDPDNTGITTLNGFYCGGGTTVSADFSGTPTTIPVGGTVNFTDLSTGSPTGWSWTFTGGTPANSTIQNPTGVQYNTAGIYPVSLTASNGSGSDTETKNNYIIVGDNPPIANFTANVTSIPVGGTVNFTDLSAGTPTLWSWTFTGGTPANSTTQNPVGVQYNAAGTYTVSLTATNDAGSDTETKNAYILVGTNPSTKPCDSLHFPIPGNMVMYSVYYSSGIYGYVSGNNGYSDKAKADIFSPMSPFTKLTGASFKFGKCKRAAGHSYKIAVHVWDNSGPSGAPGNILLTDSIPYSQINSDLMMETFTTIQFATPLDISSSFYLGIVLPSLPGDTVVLLTNKNGQTMPGTAWEQWRNDIWYPYSDINSWSYNVSHAIFPILCNPATYSINESGSDDVLVYPNPASDVINIDFGAYMYENVEVRAYNMIGKEVKKNSYIGVPTNLLQLDLSDCSDGVYILRIDNGLNKSVKKISLLK